MRVPVYVSGSVSCEDIERAFASIGVLVRSEDGRLVADPVPKFLRPEPKAVEEPATEPAANVRTLKRRTR